MSADISFPVPDPPAAKSIWCKIWSWGVLGTIAIFLLGFGGNLMTGHPLIADGFFFAGIILVLSKFLTWEEAKHDDPKKRALIIAASVVAALVLLVCASRLTRYMNRPQIAASGSNGPGDNGQSRAAIPTPTPAGTPLPSEPTHPSRLRSRVNPDAHERQTHAAPAQPEFTVPSYANSINYAPNGIAISGGIVDHPTVINKKDPPPEIEGLSIVHLNPIPGFPVIPNDPNRMARIEAYRESLGAEIDAKEFTTMPGLSITFHVSSVFVNPNFHVIWDTPCRRTSSSIKVSSSDGSTTQEGIPSVLSPQMLVTITVRSLRGYPPVNTASVIPVSPDHPK